MHSLYHHLAKIELHCHLDGSISLATIRRLAAMAKISVPASDDALTALVQAPADAKTLLDYLRPFDFMRPLLQTTQALQLAAFDVAHQAAQENVRYIEVRFAPEFSLDAGLSVASAIDAVVAGLHQAMQQDDIQATALVCGMRQSAPATNAQIFDLAAPLVGHGLVGFDFAGNEADFPTSVLTPTIRHAQALGVPLTLHAGECHCVQNIVEAVRLGIPRIGHATALYNEPAALQQFVAAGATAELCLTSNLQTKAAASLATYPYAQLMEAGAKITINTDNRTVSNTTLTQEYERFTTAFGTRVSDFYQFNLNAAAASFLPPDAREALKARIQHDYAPYRDV
ncbi:adenosine deaminase [Lacticaseibacillus sp. GG6-2]